MFAWENGWGYSRVLGELKKLRVRVGRSTVVKTFKEAGIDPGPERGRGTWDKFVKRHASTLWACDFLTVKSATLTGFVDLYLLFFIHVGSRRAFVAGGTANPTREWTAQQARNASMQMADWGLPAKYLLLHHEPRSRLKLVRWTTSDIVLPLAAWGAEPARAERRFGASRSAVVGGSMNTRPFRPADSRR